MKQLSLALKDQQLVFDEQHALLKHNFGHLANLFSNQLKQAQGKSVYVQLYEHEVKQFAMTLHYYSSKAYDFVHKVLLLPHPSSIRAWGASIDCNPGYFTDVVTLIGTTAQKKPWMSEVVLVVDAISLHKGTMWDPISKRYFGKVDYGTAVPEVSTDLATDALVFMTVGLSGHFKHPIGYVFYNKLTASVQAQLIKNCISLLHGVGLHVFASVFDGHFTNQFRAKLLGCKMKVAEIQPWFPHPNLPGSKIFVVLNVCHMIKLVRNLLGD